MHKWKLFKKSAALVLSSAVIASGVPVTAMASEAEVFSDVSGETQGETAQEEGENEDQESVSQDQLEVGEADKGLKTLKRLVQFLSASDYFAKNQFLSDLALLFLFRDFFYD